MEVTLRQAHKLVDKIGASLATLRISAVASVNIYEQGVNDEYVSALIDNFDATVQRQLDLLEARQEIRNGIQKGNTVAVDGLVARRKALLDQLATMRHVLSTIDASAVRSVPALQAKIAAMRSAAAAGSGRTFNGPSDTVEVCLVSAVAEDVIAKLVNTKQLELERVEDDLSSANVTRSNLVVLTEKTVSLLKQEGVL